MAIEHSICAGTLSIIEITKGSGGPDSGWHQSFVWYRLTGKSSDLLKAGLLHAQDMPPGRKRVNYVLGASPAAYTSVKKKAGEYMVVQYNDPPESMAVLCELALRGVVVPTAVLNMAWAPGSVEGPRRRTEISA